MPGSVYLFGGGSQIIPSIQRRFIQIKITAAPSPAQAMMEQPQLLEHKRQTHCFIGVPSPPLTGYPIGGGAPAVRGECGGGGRREGTVDKGTGGTELANGA